jgi:dTDP-glucose 4,6-dehydratase
MEKHKILFTGSLGFLFSNFIRKAAYEKYPYTFCGVDKAVSKKYLNNIYNNKIIEANYLTDISDHHIINNIFDIEKPQIVIHAASSQNNQNDFSSIKQCVDTNFLGTKVLVDAAIKNKVKKIIYLSDYQVYQSNLDPNLSIKENHSLYGTSLSSISQIAAENIITSSGLDYNILRICKVYGPRQINNEIIPSIIKSIHNNEAISLPYNGLDTLDWMHTFDFSSALLLLLKEGKNKEIYNISSGQECSVIEIIQFICNIMKSGHHLITCTNDKQNVRYCLDNQKIVKLGWKPMFKLKKGLEETVEWFLANQWALK